MSVTLKLSLQMMNGVHHNYVRALQIRALQNTAFVIKIDESSAACQAFQKSPDRN